MITKAILAIVAALGLNPHLNHPYQEWLDYIDEKELTMRRPIRHIPSGATTLHDASGGVVSQQIFIDSWGTNSIYRWHGASHTAGYKIVSSSFPAVGNYLAGFEFGTLSAIAGAGAGNWTATNRLIGDAWGSDGDTSIYMYRGVELALGGAQSGTTQLASWLVNPTTWGIPSNNESASQRAEITFRIWYRKEGLSSNCQVSTASSRLTNQAANNRMGEVTVGGTSGQTLHTLESGSGIGYIDHTVPNTTYYLGTGADAANTVVGVGVTLLAHGNPTSIGGGSNNLTDPPVSGDKIEIVGCQWYLSEGSVGAKHLSSTHAATGVVQFWNQRDGYDASEMVDNQARAARMAQSVLASEILGDGSTDATEPFDIVSWYGGHNTDGTRGYIDGVEALFDDVDTGHTGLGFTVPGTRELFTACNASVGPSRLAQQSADGYAKAIADDWLWSDGYGLLQGFYPDSLDLPTLDLYGIAYPTMEMDEFDDDPPLRGGTHPNASPEGQDTIEYFVAQHYKMTNPATAEVYFSDGEGRERSRDRTIDRSSR